MKNCSWSSTAGAWGTHASIAPTVSFAVPAFAALGMADQATTYPATKRHVIPTGLPPRKPDLV